MANYLFIWSAPCIIIGHGGVCDCCDILLSFFLGIYLHIIWNQNGKKEGKWIFYGLAFGHSYEWSVELVCEAKLNSIDSGMVFSSTRTWMTQIPSPFCLLPSPSPSPLLLLLLQNSHIQYSCMSKNSHTSKNPRNTVGFYVAKNKLDLFHSCIVENSWDNEVWKPFRCSWTHRCYLPPAMHAVRPEELFVTAHLGIPEIVLIMAR